MGDPIVQSLIILSILVLVYMFILAKELHTIGCKMNDLKQDTDTSQNKVRAYRTESQIEINNLKVSLTNLIETLGYVYVEEKKGFVKQKKTNK